jgi:hypothetical protein
MITTDKFTAPFDDFVAGVAKAVSAPADAVAGFVDGDGIPKRFQFIGGAEASETRTNDDDASVRSVTEGIALARREVFEESPSLCIERGMTGVAVSWRTFSFVLRDGRGVTVLSAENGIQSGHGAPNDSPG